MRLFETSAEKAGADMRMNYQKTLDEWKPRFREVETKLDDLPDSVGENWDDIQTDVDEKITELRHEIESMTKQFNNY